MNILVRSPNWIGDQVLAFPFFHYLREQHPEAKITAVCAPWVASIQFRGLVDEVVTLPQPSGAGRIRQMRAMEKLAKGLKSTPWDLAIALPGSFSAAWLLFRSKASVRRGFTGDGRSILLNETIPATPFRYAHRSEAYAALATSTRWSETRTFSQSRPAFDIEKHWPAEVWHEPPKDPYWVLAPGSMAVSRQWGAEAFLKLARLIGKENSWPVVIAGGPAERIMASEFQAEKSLRWIDLTGQGPVSSLAKIFRNAQFTISNDSGLAHVAALCGSPVEVIWGAGDPQRTAPLGPNRVGIHNRPIPCWPCEKNTCANKGDDYLRCLRAIDPAAVWEQIRPRLS